MKLHSRHTSREGAQAKRVARVVLLVFVLLVGAFFIPSLFSYAGQLAMAPVHTVNAWLRESQSRLPMFLREQHGLIKRIDELENQLAVAKSTDLTQQRLQEENEWLRTLLNAPEQDRIAAAVIARPGQLPYDYIQIDRGESSGIIEGAPVFIGKDNVIGVIVHTTPHYSFAELFTSPHFSATAFISGVNVVATVDGYGGGVARVRVPQGVPISVGNLVHLPSISPGVLGRIAYVESEPSQPEQFGYIALSEPVSGIHYVAVAKEIVSPMPLPVIEERVRAAMTEALLLDMPQVQVATTTATSS